MPALTADAFFAGETKAPKVASLDPAQAVANGSKATTTTKAFKPQVAASAATPATGSDGSSVARSGSSNSLHGLASDPKRDPLQNPQNEKEYMDAFHALRKENDDLKKTLASYEAKTRSLEIKIADMGR